MKKIDAKVVTYEVVKKPTNTPTVKVPIKEQLVRPFELTGSTYKLRTQVYKHAFYVTLNDFNGKPFEMFIHSKNNNVSVWTGSFTLMASAIFRGVADIGFLVKEMLEAVDPMGGHYAHHVHHESIVAEIFYLIDCRMKGIPINKKEQSIVENSALQPGQFESESCPDCSGTVWRMLDGCPRCENCSFSKCG